MKWIFICCFLTFSYLQGQTQPSKQTSEPTLKGLSIAAPKAEHIDRFISFIQNELGPNGVNTLLLRVDYNYEYQSHPELQNQNALSNEQVKAIVKACRYHGITIVPQINLLGHQSWAGSLEKLLSVYPQFDETP